MTHTKTSIALMKLSQNRQAELDLQAFPNGVWERGKSEFIQGFVIMNFELANHAFLPKENELAKGSTVCE